MMAQFSTILFFIGYLYLCAGVTIKKRENVEVKFSITSISRFDTPIAVAPKRLVTSKEIAIALEKFRSAQGKITTTLGINEEVDIALSTISEDLLLNYDPVSLPDQKISFDYKPLLITYHGTLSLGKGALQELSSITRNGDAVLVYTFDTEVSEITIPVSFKHLIVRYDFTMDVKGDTVDGLVFAWLNDVQGVYKFEFKNADVLSEDLLFQVNDLEIDVYSVDISSAYTKLIAKLTTDPLPSVALEYAKNIVGSYLNSIITSELGSSN
ncbi:hypothetical protein Trydic_g13941 [Trypoxylus dichotomus]